MIVEVAASASPIGHQEKCGKQRTGIPFRYNCALRSVMRTRELLLITMLGACSGGSGASGDAEITELSSAEAMNICNVRDRINDAQLTKVGCYLYLIQQEKEFLDICELSIEECLAAPPAEIAFLGASYRCIVPEDGPDYPACASEVTVRELQNCYDDRFNDFIAIERSISCDFDPATEISEIASCEAIEATCPGIL